MNPTRGALAKRAASKATVVAFLAALAPLPIRGVRAGDPSPPVVDLHVDLSYRITYQRGTLERGSGQYPAAELLGAGVAGVVLPLFVPDEVAPGGPRLSDLEGSRANLLEVLPTVQPYATPGCAPQNGKVRTWFSLEGSAPLAFDRTSASTWAARGVRIFGLVHTHDNVLATSSSGGPKTSGLTEEGRKLVHDIDRAGGIVDVSHASDAAFADVLAEATKDGAPVVATHSDARALTEHPRNLTDEQVRAIARSGGVVGVNFHSRFLTPRGRATMTDVVRHLMYLVHVGGADHVAIGSDYEGDIVPPVGMDSVRAFPRLHEALRRAGLAQDDVARIFGGNALRLLCPRDATPGAAGAAPPPPPASAPFPASSAGVRR